MTRQINGKFIITWWDQWGLTRRNSLLAPCLKNLFGTLLNTVRLWSDFGATADSDGVLASDLIREGHGKQFSMRIYEFSMRIYNSLTLSKWESCDQYLAVEAIFREVNSNAGFRVCI